MPAETIKSKMIGKKSMLESVLSIVMLQLLSLKRARYSILDTFFRFRAKDEILMKLMWHGGKKGKQIPLSRSEFYYFIENNSSSSRRLIKLVLFQCHW